MLEALSTPRNRITTFVLLAMCGLLAIGAAVVGISDNPPGLVLALFSAAALVLAFVHPWRTSKQYRYLFYVTFVVFFISAVVHGVFEVLGQRLGGAGLVAGALTGVGVLLFLVAVLLCPPCMVVSAIGAIVMAIRNRRRRGAAPPVSA